MIEQRALDHIVYAVSDLDEACIQIEGLLGVAPVFGGYYQIQGTKNALTEDIKTVCQIESFFASSIVEFNIMLKARSSIL